MELISIILPSLRPKELFPCIDKVKENSKGINYELIVICPFEVRGENIVWVPEEQSGGTIRSINFGYWKSSGQWITVLTDESRPQKDWLKNMVDWVNSRRDHLEKSKILPAFKVEPYALFEYYGKEFAPFPFANRNFLNSIGGLFDPIFRSFYADPDLSLRVYQAGGDVIHVENAAIEHHHHNPDKVHKNNKNKYFLADREAFRKRWDHLGEFKEPTLSIPERIKIVLNRQFSR